MVIFIRLLLIIYIQTMFIGYSQAQPIQQNFDGISFIKVDSHQFTFGADSHHQYRKENENRRVIPLGHTFWISKYEITQGQWIAVGCKNLGG